MGVKTDTSRMKELDTTGIEELFIETPVRKGRVKRLDTKAYSPPKINLKPLKQPQNGLQGVSSLRLVRELIVRHYKVTLIALFSALVGAFVSVGTR